MFGLPGGMEWVILAIIALLVFGGSRLASAGKNAGKAIREFKEETSSLKKTDSPPNTTTRTSVATCSGASRPVRRHKSPVVTIISGMNSAVATTKPE